MTTKVGEKKSLADSEMDQKSKSLPHRLIDILVCMVARDDEFSASHSIREHNTLIWQCGSAWSCLEQLVLSGGASFHRLISEIATAQEKDHSEQVHVKLGLSSHPGPEP